MKNLFKKIGALLVAAVMVLSMCSTVSVFAENKKPEPGDKATATVKNVEATATVTAYHIVEGDYNDSGLIGYKAANGVTIGNLYNPTDGEIVNLSKNVNGLENVTMNGGTPNAEGLADFTADLTAGTWMVLVTGAVDEVYNPMIVSINYKTGEENGSGSSNELKPGEVDANSDWTLTTPVAYAKSTKPTIAKTIVNPGTSGNTKGNDVAYGDSVNFNIATAIPSYSGKYESVTVKISDTLSQGLKLDKKPNSKDYNVTVKVGADNVEQGENYSNYKLEPSDNGFTITFNSDYALANSGKSVTVTYSATLQENAPVNFDPNTNTATLTYSNDPTNKDNVKNVTDKTYHYTFAIGGSLFGNSTAEWNKTTTVLGKYTSETKTEDGKTVYTTPLGGAKFQLKNNTTQKTYEAVSDGTTGSLVFNGLDAGEYTLKEIEAPKGYSLNNKTYTVKIEATYNNDGTLNKYTISIDGKKTSEYTATYTGEGTKTITNITINSENETQIPNTKLSSLPSTGGMGTYLFTIIGVVVMAGAAGAFFISRRKGSEE